jgi:uncharacterized YigZ family protein
MTGLKREYHDATHICWAWRLLSEPEPGEASSDAGEPAGTAGVPILGALQSGDLWNVLGVVIRWFGGTKLGRGGLVRAYRDSMALAVQNAGIVETLIRVAADINAPMARLGEIHRLLSALDISYGEQRTERQEVCLSITIPARDVDRLSRQIVEATHGEGSLSLHERAT